MRPKFNSKLRTDAIRLLKHTHIELKQISKDTGLSESWLSLLRQGRITHADVGRVETLYNYLSDTPLKV